MGKAQRDVCGKTMNSHGLSIVKAFFRDTTENLYSRKSPNIIPGQRDQQYKAYTLLSLSPHIKQQIYASTTSTIRPFSISVSYCGQKEICDICISKKENHLNPVF